MTLLVSIQDSPSLWMDFHSFWSSCVLRSPRSSSTSTILRTSRPWMSQGLPAKRLPSRFWMCFTARWVRAWNCGPVQPFFLVSLQTTSVFPVVQLDCCGKGDDTALFKQVAGTLCPRKSPETTNHKSQVSSKRSLRDLGFKRQGSFGLFCSLCKSSFHLLASVSTQSCHDKLIELFSEKLYLIGLAALVVAVVMVSIPST